jgi:hypothetical protein
MAAPPDRIGRRDVRPAADGAAAGAETSTRWANRSARLVGYAGGVALGIGVLAIALSLARGDFPWRHGIGDSTANVAAKWQRPAVSAAGLVGRTGVSITQLAVTGDGGLLDLRFQVVDPTKADAIHDRARPPALISEVNGVVASDLLMGHEHTGTFRGGQTYYLVFTNPGNLVERGSQVTVLLGDASVRHVRVR